MSSILTAPLFAYDKSKNLLLKATLPFLIIVHHALNYLPTNELHFIELYGGHIAMFAFFGMSGYGLMHCYRERKNYLNGFLQRSLCTINHCVYSVPHFSFCTRHESYRLSVQHTLAWLCLFLMVHFLFGLLLSLLFPCL